jgi:hypothetical protein
MSVYLKIFFKNYYVNPYNDSYSFRPLTTGFLNVTWIDHLTFRFWFGQIDDECADFDRYMTVPNRDRDQS